VIYLDTSVLVAIYCPEPLSEKADRIARREGPAAISELTEVEVSSAIARKVRAGELVVGDARKILALFASHASSGWFDRISIEAAHYRQARDWIGRMSRPLRALDGLHLALAASSGRTLVTADPALYRSARAFRVPARLLKP
jgi:uncharacterized protein